MVMLVSAGNGHLVIFLRSERGCFHPTRTLVSNDHGVGVVDDSVANDISQQWVR